VFSQCRHHVSGLNVGQSTIAPLGTHDGHSIDTRCTIDVTSRIINPEAAIILETLAQVIRAQIELWYTAQHSDDLHQEQPCSSPKAVNP
jgi:hypothetical protein